MATVAGYAAQGVENDLAVFGGSTASGQKGFLINDCDFDAAGYAASILGTGVTATNEATVVLLWICGASIYCRCILVHSMWFIRTL